MSTMTEAEIDAAANIENILKSHERWRTGLLLLSYVSDDGESRLAQAWAIDGRPGHIEQAAIDATKMPRRLRELADELERTLASMVVGGDGVRPMEVRRKS